MHDPSLGGIGPASEAPGGANARRCARNRCAHMRERALRGQRANRRWGPAARFQCGVFALLRRDFVTLLTIAGNRNGSQFQKQVLIRERTFDEGELAPVCDIGMPHNPIRKRSLGACLGALKLASHSRSSISLSPGWRTHPDLRSRIAGGTDLSVLRPRIPKIRNAASRSNAITTISTA
jgi:hypothetical protein